MQQETEILDGGIVADTLKGHIQLIVLVALHLQALGRAADMVQVAQVDGADETESDGRGVVALEIIVENGLQTHTGGGGAAGAGYHVAGHGLGRIGGYIEHPGAALERTVVVVGSHTLCMVEESESVALIVDYLHIGRLAAGVHFSPLAVYGYHLHGIGAADESHHIGASVGTVVAHQLLIYLGIVDISATFHIHMVALGTLHKVPFHISRLVPSAGLGYLDPVVGHHTLGNLGQRFGEGDVAHGAIEHILLILLGAHRDGRLLLVHIHTAQVVRVVIENIAVVERHLHLPRIKVLTHVVAVGILVGVGGVALDGGRHTSDRQVVDIDTAAVGSEGHLSVGLHNTGGLGARALPLLEVANSTVSSCPFFRLGRVIVTLVPLAHIRASLPSPKRTLPLLSSVVVVKSRPWVMVSSAPLAMSGASVCAAVYDQRSLLLSFIQLLS